MAEVDGRTLRPMPFDVAAFGVDPALFGEGGHLPDRNTSEGRARTGLRLQYPLNARARTVKVAVFQWAGHFPNVALRSTYGLLARGLAIDRGSGRRRSFPPSPAYGFGRGNPMPPR
jgi:glucan biosynthesis protein